MGRRFKSDVAHRFRRPRRCRTTASSSSSPFASMHDIPQTQVLVPIGPYVDNVDDVGEVVPMITLDCDHVMEAYIAANQYDRDPYWTCIWPSSQAIAALLLSGLTADKAVGDPSPVDIDVRGLRVADFGAGLGLAGVAAGLAGAREVVFLDREPLSLACCVANAELNGCAERIVPVEFDWNLPVGVLEHRFDCILVCDCLYEKFSVEPIARVLPQLLGESTNAKIVLADPPNRAKANRDKFLGLMKVYGFELTKEVRVDVNEMTEASVPSYKRTEVVLIVLQRTG